MEQTALQEKHANPLENLQGRNLISLTFEELSELYPQIRDYSVKVYEARALVQHLLVQHMLERQATKIQQGDVTMTLKTDPQREFNYELLEQELQPLISESQWQQMISYEPKVSWFRLKQLKKLGGKILEVIERAVRENDKYFLSVSSKNGVLPSVIREKIYPAERARSNGT